MANLTLFTAEQVSKFRDDIVRLKVKQKIAGRAISLASRYIFYTEFFPAFIHCAHFKRHIGDVDRDPFPKWLKCNLFQEVDSTYIPGEKCKGWVVNQDFYLEIRQLLEDVKVEGTVEETVKKLGAKDIAKLYAPELAGNKAFEYSEGADGRLYHPLQGVKRELKSTLLYKDFNDYDISSAAPTILFQLYHRLCAKIGIQYNRFNELGYVDYYINNKDEVRRDFAERYNIDEDVAKKIINSFFNKARLAANGYCIIFSKYLEHDVERMKAMQEDVFVKNLKRDVSWMWAKIESGFNDDYVMRRDKKIKRWHWYFKEERKILDVVIEELTKITGAPHLGFAIEHDGFRLHKRYDLDINHLENVIEQRTGYNLTFVNK